MKISDGMVNRTGKLVAPPKILIVEDDGIIGQHLLKALKKLNYDVVGVVSNGKEAIQITSETTPDLILMDIILEGDLDGIETASRIHQRSNIPIIYLTAYGDAEILQRAKVTEPCGFILKPFDERTLQASIEIALQKNALGNQLKESEELFNAVIDQATEGFLLLHTEDFGIIKANLAFQKMIGVELQQKLGQPVDSLSGLGLLSFQGFMDQIKLGIELSAENCRLDHKDGSFVDVEIDARTIPFEDHKAICITLRDVTSQKQIEEELLLNEVRFNSIIEDQSDFFVRWGSDGTRTSVNQSFCRYLQKTSEELLGTNHYNFFMPNDQAVIRECLLNLSPEKPASTNEMLVILPNGEKRWHSWTDRVIFTESNEILEIQSVGKDINDKKQSRELFNRYQLLSENTRDIILFIRQRDGRIIEANKTAVLAYGYSRDELLTLSIHALHSRHTQSLVSPQMEKANATGLLYETVHRHKNGSLFPVEVNSQGATLGGERILLSVVREISERKEVEEALRESEERFRQVVQQMPFPVEVFNHEGTTVILNSAFMEGFEIPTESIIIGHYNIFRDPFFKELGFSVNVKRVFSGETVVIPEISFPLEMIQTVFQGKKGSNSIYEITLFPVYKQPGEVYQVVSIWKDVTERIQGEHELQAIAGVSSALSTAATRAEMLPMILDQIKVLLHPNCSALVMRDPASGESIVELGLGSWKKIKGLRLHGEEGVVGTVISKRLPSINQDISEDPVFALPELLNSNLVTAIEPIVIQENSIGAIYLARNKPFSDADTHLINSIANISASALHRASLYEQTQQHAEQMAKVSAIGRSMSETFDLKQIYDQMTQAILELFPETCTVCISMYDEAKEEIKWEYGVHDGERLDVTQSPPFPLEPPGTGTQSEVIHLHKPVIINDLRLRRKQIMTDFLVRPQRIVTQSGLYVPMLSRGHVMGVIQVLSYTPNRFTQEDAELLTVVGNTAAIAIENTRLFLETQNRLKRLIALRAIDTAITSGMNLNSTLDVLLDKVNDLLHPDAVDVQLLNTNTKTLDFGYGRGFNIDPIDSRGIKMEGGLAGRVVASGQVLYVPDLSKTDLPPQAAELYQKEGFTSYTAAPLVSKEQVIGVLELFHRSFLNPDQEWLDFLQTLAGQTAIAIDKATLLFNLQASNLELTLAYDTTLEGWSHALELRDRETEGHSRRVTKLTEQLSKAMGLPESEIVHIRRGALLHDIGKLGTPDNILLKPGLLTQDERKIMQRHPTFAYEMLLPINFLRSSLDIPYGHHEKWDGTGYPLGLKNEEIPLSARIFAIVDVFDSLQNDRPYRTAWPLDQIKDYLLEQSGKHFDPKVVEAFMKLDIWDK
jgi:PAS domain S-box-containing protein/putative nucleotidyltransferase with HDIG domain